MQKNHAPTHPGRKTDDRDPKGREPGRGGHRENRLPNGGARSGEPPKKRY